jgi:hypothetical protein
LVDCHLSYKPLSWSAPLNTLHYTQPRCPPTLYQWELNTSSSKTMPMPAIFEDDDAVLVAESSSSHPVPAVPAAQPPWTLPISLLPLNLWLARLIPSRSVPWPLTCLLLSWKRTQTHRRLHLCPDSFRQCLGMILLSSSTTLALHFCLFDCVTRPMLPIQKRIGHQRSSIKLWVAASFAIINICLRSAVMGSGFMAASFRRLSAPTQLSPKPSMAAFWIKQNIDTSTPSTWTSRLGTVFQLVASAMLLIWWIALPAIIGHSA